MVYVRITSLIIGSLMIGQWVFFIISGNVPELDSAPLEIAFHLSAEAITALLLISTFFILKKPTPQTKFVATFSQGLLAYTVINSSGYFAQSGNWFFLIIFGLLLLLALLNVYFIIKQ